MCVKSVQWFIFPSPFAYPACPFTVVFIIVEQGKLTASAVGSIVGMQSAEIQQIASEYAEKVFA